MLPSDWRTSVFSGRFSKAAGPGFLEYQVFQALPWGLPYQLSRVQVSELDLNELYLPSWISDLLVTDLSTCQFI